MRTCSRKGSISTSLTPSLICAEIILEKTYIPVNSAILAMSIGDQCERKLEVVNLVCIHISFFLQQTAKRFR
jgi:hypothetical protein